MYFATMLKKTIFMNYANIDWMGHTASCAVTSLRFEYDTVQFEQLAFFILFRILFRSNNHRSN